MGIDTNFIVGQDYDNCICSVCTDIFEDVIMLKPRVEKSQFFTPNILPTFWCKKTNIAVQNCGIALGVRLDLWLVIIVLG